MTIIQKFIILAALLGGLALSFPVESNDADAIEQPAGCCSSCMMQGTGSEYCRRCSELNGGC